MMYTTNYNLFKTPMYQKSFCRFHIHLDVVGLPISDSKNENKESSDTCVVRMTS